MTLQHISYKNKYSLSFAEYGNKKGFPILIQHGMIASIKDADIFSPLIDLGVRVICIARPGYGESSPYEMRNIADWGVIVANLVDELNLDQFDILGISSGAPYGYAIAHQLPEKTRNVFILSGIPALYDAKVQAHWPFDIQDDADLLEMQQLAHQIFFSSITDDDLKSDAIRDSMKHDCFGIGLDLRIRCMDWGFKMEDIKNKVFMRHSKADNSVPFITAQITSQLLPNCRLDIKENDVHFSQEVMNDFIKTVMNARLNRCV